MSDKTPVKINAKHGGKEFKSFFHFIGKVKPVRKKNQMTDGWEDLPFYEQGETRNTKKPMRKLQFNLETAESNELKLELFGMEQKSVWPYSSKHRKAATVAWNDRDDKTKYPDDTYHLIDPDWDKALKFSKLIVGEEVWVEVKGSYEPYNFVNDVGESFDNIRRVIGSINVITNGEEIKMGKDKFNYTTDFKSPDFKEVNYFDIQTGIRSTYYDDSKDETIVNGVFLSYGKERSEPNDIKFVVYQKEAAEGKMSLANAFATLEEGDFLQVTGHDNNRAVFAWIDVEDTIDQSDPFADVADEDKKVRQERVVSGGKKGLEITSYVTGSLVRGFLSVDEISKAAQVTNEIPFSSGGYVDPFADDGKPIEITEDMLPF